MKTDIESSSVCNNHKVWWFEYALEGGQPALVNRPVDPLMYITMKSRTSGEILHKLIL